ncbi:MAG TPA: hypothetical protein VEC12_00235 [Bacteroidia bacterium]|nr:hypothetical protein [Bacteroidia bacterium]
MSKSVLLLFILSWLYQAAKAQDNVADSAYSKAAYNNAVDIYHKYTDKQSRLYNGWLHIGYSNKIEGFAYYPENAWQNGTVVYDGISFPGVNMLYDVYKDELIIQHFHKLMQNLHSEKVKEFTFGNRRFIRVVRDSLNNVTLNTGFYEELYKGKLHLLAKRQKILEETVTDKLEQKFITKNFFYLNRNNTWHTVKSYRDLTGVLKEKAKEIRQHLKKNKVKYRKNREKALVMAVQYFDATTQ